MKTYDEKIELTNVEAIDVLEKNRPSCGYVMLQNALDKAIEVLKREEDVILVNVVAKKIKHIFRSDSPAMCEFCEKADCILDCENCIKCENAIEKMVRSWKLVKEDLDEED